MAGFEITVGMDLFRPIQMPVLAVIVDEREIGLAHAGHFPGRFRLALQTEVGEPAVEQPLHLVRLEGPLHFERDRIDL